MLYKHYNQVAVNTAEKDAEATSIAVIKGVIKQWIIFIPHQAADLLHVQVRYHDQQVIPFNRDESYNVANSKVPWEDHFEVLEAPYELDFIAWNEDDLYPHEFIALINIIPIEKLSFWRRWFK